MPSLKTAVNRIQKAKKASDLVSGSLDKLIIYSYSDDAYSKDEKKYTVQFNPSQLEESIKVEYKNGEPPPNSTGSDAKFVHVKPTELKIKLTIDGTGVSGASGTTGKSGKFGVSSDEFDVHKEIEAFKSITTAYIGDAHDIPFCKILWGELEFKGRLASLNISHVLFKSDGRPLRSILDAVFSSATNLKTMALEANKKSPDLTHSRIVQVGDTLPLMCKTIYNDPSYYLKIARFNNIVDFRNLEPGTEIIFPPIV